MPRSRDPYDILARAILGYPLPARRDDDAPRATRGPTPAPRRRRGALRLVGGDNAEPSRASHPDGPRPALVLLK